MLASETGEKELLREAFAALSAWHIVFFSPLFLVTLALVLPTADLLSKGKSGWCRVALIMGGAHKASA